MTAKPGPTPTPTAQLALVGSRRAKAREGKEPKAPASKPTQPPHLSADQKRVWKRLLDYLDTMGLLSSVDRDMLELYCVAYVRWRQCEQFIAKHGIKYPIKNKQGETASLAQFPEVAEARSLSKQLIVIGREFGLSPSARARIGIDRVQAPKETHDVGRVGFTAG